VTSESKEFFKRIDKQRKQFERMPGIDPNAWTV
jgi:hypothetical protein